MNLLHLKYAVEVAKYGSVNKTAEKLFIEPPNLSRAIKGLESSLGTTLFFRTPKGMLPTPDGERFIRYAESILKQIDALETLFDRDAPKKKHFSVSVPRTSYISEAFSSFSLLLKNETDVEIFYKETNSLRAVKNILEENYRLGILRYAENYGGYYKTMLEEKGLSGTLIAEFRYVPVMSEKSPLAAKSTLTYDDFADFIEIAHADPYVPSLTMAEVRKEELPDNIRRRIFVFERASQFELLSKNAETFMWMAPMPDSILKRYGLVSGICNENKQRYRDVLIHRHDYTLSELDKMFISELQKTAPKHLH